MAMTKDEKIFISGVLGESSVANIFEEMAAIAAVLDRQRKARGFTTWDAFSTKDSTFAYGFNVAKNARAALVMNAKDSDVEKKEPLATAYRAVRHVLDGGPDYSNGAYFWDGNDLKTNYKKHFKVKAGIKFTNAEHNIFDVEDSTKNYEAYFVTVQDGKKVKEKFTEDHVYDSTVAYSGTYTKTKVVMTKNPKGKMVKKNVTIEVKTGTVFWKITPNYVKYFNGGREYK